VAKVTLDIGMIWKTNDALARANSNVEIIQRFQNKYLGNIVNTPCYVTNDTLRHDLNLPYVRGEIKKQSEKRRQIGETQRATLTS